MAKSRQEEIIKMGRALCLAGPEYSLAREGFYKVGPVRIERRVDIGYGATVDDLDIFSVTKGYAMIVVTMLANSQNRRSTNQAIGKK